MTQYFARAVNGVVEEIITAPDGVAIHDCFAPALVATMTACDSTIQVGQSLSGGVFGPPPAPPAPTKAQLVTYALTKQTRIIEGGLTVNVGTAQSPVNVSADTDTAGRADLSGVVQLVSLAPNSTVTWYQPAGAVTLTAAQVVQLGTAVATFVMEAYAASAAVQGAIAAGTITTYAQVDAHAWPVNS